MPTRIAKRWLAGLALTALATLVACVSTPAPANPDVQGRWRLDAAASDDASARIAGAIHAAQAKFRKNRHFFGGAGGAPPDDASDGGGPDDQGPDLGGQLGDNGLIGPDFRELAERLQQTLGSPRTLNFRVQADDVLIQRDDLPARDYQPGETITRFDEYGTAQVRAEWKEKAFLIAQRFTSGARLEERYELDAHGALIYTRSLRDPTVGRLAIRSVYRRAAP